MKVRLLNDLQYMVLVLHKGEVYQARKSGTNGYEIEVEIGTIHDDTKIYHWYWVNREDVEVVNG